MTSFIVEIIAPTPEKLYAYIFFHLPVIRGTDPAVAIVIRKDILTVLRIDTFQMIQFYNINGLAYGIRVGIGRALQSRKRQKFILRNAQIGRCFPFKSSVNGRPAISNSHPYFEWWHPDWPALK